MHESLDSKSKCLLLFILQSLRATVEATSSMAWQRGKGEEGRDLPSTMRKVSTQVPHTLYRLPS